MRYYQRPVGPRVDDSQRAFDDVVASTREDLGKTFGDLRGIPRPVLHPFTPTMARSSSDPAEGPREIRSRTLRDVVEYEPRGGIAGLFDRLLLARGIRRAFERTFASLEQKLPIVGPPA